MDCTNNAAAAQYTDCISRLAETGADVSLPVTIGLILLGSGLLLALILWASRVQAVDTDAFGNEARQDETE